MLGSLWALSLVVVLQGGAGWRQWLIAIVGGIIVAVTLGMAILLMHRRLRRHRSG